MKDGLTFLTVRARGLTSMKTWKSIYPLVVTSAWVSIAHVVAQVPAFFVPVVTAAVLGANAATDAFFLAFAVASLVVNSVVGASQAAVPYLVADGDRALRRVGWLLTCIAVGLQLGAVIVLGPLSEAFSVIPADRRDAVQAFLFALTPFVALSAASAIWTAATSARRDYLAGAWAQALRSVLLLGLVITIGPVIDVWGLLLAYVASELGRATVLFFWLTRPAASGFSPGTVGDNPRAMGITGSLLAQVTGSALVAAVPIIDRAMAMLLGPGSVSLLEYAERIWQIPLSLAMTGFTVVSLTEWSANSRSADTGPNVRQEATTVATLFFALSLPVCLAVVLLRGPVTEVLFGHGRIPETELPRLAATLAVLVAGIPLYLVGLVYSRVFLATRRSDVLLIVTLLGFGLKLVLNFALSQRWGLPGIAAATSFMYVFNTLGLLAALGLLRPSK